MASPNSVKAAARYDAKAYVAGEGPPNGLEAYPGGMQPEDFVVSAPSNRVLFAGDTLVDGGRVPMTGPPRIAKHHFVSLRRLLQLDVVVLRRTVAWSACSSYSSSLRRA